MDLLADWLAGRDPPSCPHDRRVVLTRSGREAIALAMRHWNVGRGDEVLVPAYNCGSEISPAISTGARVLMYRVDRKAEIDIDDIRRRMSERTKAVFVTHYFGRPVDLRALGPFCRQSGAKLLEDCAHSVFGARVGGIGDAAVFSLRKTFPASDGGILALRPSGDGEADLRIQAPPSLEARGALSLGKRWLQRRFWIGVGASAKDADALGATKESGKSADAALPDIPRSYYYVPGAPIVGASRLARGLLTRIDKTEIIERRRINYDILAKSMRGVRGFSPLWDGKPLEPDVCPLGLPGLVGDKRRWLHRLNRAGVSVSPWWTGFHRGLNWDEFPEARMLKQSLILLPVHQDLTVADIEYIAAIARSIES